MSLVSATAEHVAFYWCNHFSITHRTKHSLHHTALYFKRIALVSNACEQCQYRTVYNLTSAEYSAFYDFTIVLCVRLLRGSRGSCLNYHVLIDCSAPKGNSKAVRSICHKYSANHSYQTATQCPSRSCHKLPCGRCAGMELSPSNKIKLSRY